MKKLFLLLTLVATTLVACAQQGKSTTFTKFDGAKISGLSVGGAWHVTVRQGSATKVTVTVSEQYKDYFKYELSNGIFVVKQIRDEKRNNGSMFNQKYGKYNIDIICSSLDVLDLSGASDVELIGNFSANVCSIETSGASKVETENGSISCNSSKIDLSGASKMELNLNAKEDVYMEVSGASNIDCKIVANSFKSTASGASSVELEGRANSVRFDISGASKIYADEFVGKDVYVDASGAAYIKVHATDRLEVDKSGAASIAYKGNPTIKMDGQLKKLD